MVAVQKGILSQTGRQMSRSDNEKFRLSCRFHVFIRIFSQTPHLQEKMKVEEKQQNKTKEEINSVMGKMRGDACGNFNYL